MMIRENELETYLENIFGWSSFRAGQKEIISDILTGNDVLGVLPTGSGKSLCYQLPAQLLVGQTIVVSPLISLMEDQVKQLRSKGIKNVVAINSFMSYRERQDVYKNLESYQLIYVSPEILQQKELFNHFKKLTISLFVVDEAHCISQWGHEFRPDYLRLINIINELDHPPILALSATVTKQIKADILSSLNRPHMKKHIYPVNRENIILNVKQVDHDLEKNLYITQFLKERWEPTLIYFSSRRATEKLTELLQTELPRHRIAFYHGGMDSTDRISVQQQFMNDQLDIVCCTSAFGMGIDKNDIRLVIHYHIPSQIESFIQEIGRAGRDGKESLSLVLHHSGDQALPERLIANELPNYQQITMVFQQLKNIYDKNEQIPSNDEEINRTFNCDLTQWRFLFYQLENSGIINDNQVFYNENKWQKIEAKIKQIRDQRFVYKQQQLHAMVTWLQSKACLRKSLFKNFQSTVINQPDNCCQYCGFDIDKWRTMNLYASRTKVETWQQRLKNVLYYERNP